MKRTAKPSSGLGLARTRMATMPEDELSLLTSDRLIASYGLTLSEADYLIRSFQGRL
jgi:hypothetical protein